MLEGFQQNALLDTTRESQSSQQPARPPNTQEESE